MGDGTPFGRYRLLDLLGRGGMGEVWRAFDTGTERVVALKVLPTQYADDPVFQERFRREARSAARLDEPHVVPIYDFGEIDGRLFVTMRLIQGRDLHSILRDERIEPARAVGIIDQVASALHAAHRSGLVHRDVKPSNILVSEDDFAYLIDFGVARAAGQTGLTSTSNVIGTWAYMAPERMSTGQTDSRADIYALACVLYECLTGSQPYGGGSLEQQIAGHLTVAPPRVTDRRVDAPAELDAVIARGMAKNPDDRYATSREMAQAARVAVTGPHSGPNPLPQTVAAPPSNPYPNRQRQFGDFSNRFTAPPSTSPATDPTQYRPMPPPAFPHRPYPHPPYPQGPIPQGPRPSRKGRLIAFSSLGAAAVIVAVVAAIAVSNSGDQDPPLANNTSTTPSALPNTGPFTGTFKVAMGPMTTSDGKPVDRADAAAFSETWRLRSACGAKGCVATASTGGLYTTKDLVFDQVGGSWLAVTTSPGKCDNRDAEQWDVISLQPQADGTMSGEWTKTNVYGCFDKRTATFTRTADTDIALLPDPTTLPPRVVSPAEALHGSYDSQVTYADGYKSDVDHFAVRTGCLHTGDRCISQFTDPKSGGGQTFAFGNGAWTRNEEFEAKCSSGGTHHVKWTATLPLPQPPQDPISLLTGHGHIEAGPGTKCISSAFDETFTRTGD